MASFTTVSKYLSGIVIYGKMRTSGWIGFLLVTSLPFVGVRFFDWLPGLILASYVLDRIVYVVFYFGFETLMLYRSSGRLKPRLFLRELLSLIVICYLLVQLFALTATLTGIFTSWGMVSELGTMAGVICLHYGGQFILSILSAKPANWKPRVANEGVRIVILTSVTIMVSLILGIFLTVAIKDTMLAPFFGNGYGIVMFLFVLIKLVSDLLYFGGGQVD